MPTLSHVVALLGAVVPVTSVLGQVSCDGITFHSLSSCDQLCSPVVEQSVSALAGFTDCARRSWCKYDQGDCVFHDFATEKQVILDELDENGWSSYQRESFINMMNHAHCSRNNRREKDCGLLNYLQHGDEVSQSLLNYTVEDGHESLCGWPSIRGDSFGCHASSQYCNFNKGSVRKIQTACNAHDECEWDTNFALSRNYKRSSKLYKQYNQACKPKVLLDDSACDSLSNLPPGSDCDEMQLCDATFAANVEDIFFPAMDSVCSAVSFDAPGAFVGTVSFKNSGFVPGFEAPETYYGAIWDDQCTTTSSVDFRRGQYRHDSESRSTVAELPHYGNQHVSMRFQQDSAQTDATYFQLKRNLTAASSDECPVGATGYLVSSEPTVLHKECSYFQLDQDCVDKTITSVVEMNAFGFGSQFTNEGYVSVGDAPGAPNPSVRFAAQLPETTVVSSGGVIHANQFSTITEFNFIPAFSELSGKRESRLGRSFERVTRGETTLRDGYVDFSISQVNATVRYADFNPTTTISSANSEACASPDVSGEGTFAVQVLAQDDGDVINAHMSLVDVAGDQSMTVSINKTRTMTEDVALETLQALVNPADQQQQTRKRNKKNQNIWSAALAAEEILSAAGLNLRTMRNSVAKQIRTGVKMGPELIAGTRCGVFNYTGSISLEYKDVGDEERVSTSLNGPGLNINSTAGDWQFRLQLELPTISDDIENTDAFDVPYDQRRRRLTSGSQGSGGIFTEQTCFERPRAAGWAPQNLGSKKGFQVFDSRKCDGFGKPGKIDPSDCRCNKLARGINGSCKMKVVTAGTCSGGIKKFHNLGQGWKTCKGLACKANNDGARRLLEAIDKQFSFRGLSVSQSIDEDGQIVLDGSEFFYQPSFQVKSVFPKDGSAPIHKILYPFQPSMPLGSAVKNICADTGGEWARTATVSFSTVDDAKAVTYQCVDETDESCVVLDPSYVSDVPSMQVMLPSGSSDNEENVKKHNFDVTLTQTNGDSDTCGQLDNTKMEIEVNVEDYNDATSVSSNVEPTDARSKVSFESTGNSLQDFKISVVTVNWNTQVLRNHDMVLEDQDQERVYASTYVDATVADQPTLTTTFSFDGESYCFEARFDNGAGDSGNIFSPSIQIGETSDSYAGTCEMGKVACFDSTAKVFECKVFEPTASPTKSPTHECPEVVCPNGFTLATSLDKALVGTNSQRELPCPICTKQCENMEIVKYAMELVTTLRCEPHAKHVMGTCGSELECLDMCEADDACFGAAFQHVNERNAPVDGLLLTSVNANCAPLESIGAWEVGVWAIYAKVPICKADPPTEPPSTTEPPSPTYPPSPTVTDPPSATPPPVDDVPECIYAYYRNPTGFQGYEDFSTITQVPAPLKRYALMNEEACARQGGKQKRLSYKWEPVIGVRNSHNAGVFSEMHVAKSIQKLFQEHTGTPYPESFDDFDVEELQYPMDQQALGECYVKRGGRWATVDQVRNVQCREPEAQLLNLLFLYNLDGQTYNEDGLSRCVFSTDNQLLYVDRCHERVLPASSPANELSSQTFELLPKTEAEHGNKAGMVELRHYYSGKCIGVGSIAATDFQIVQESVPLPHIYFNDATYNIQERSVTLRGCENNLETLFEPISGGRFLHVATGLCLGEHRNGLLRGVLQLQTCDPEVFSTSSNSVPDSGCFTINVKYSKRDERSQRKAECEQFPDGCKFEDGKCLEASQYYAPYRVVGPSVVDKDTCLQFRGPKDIDRLQCFRYTECSWIRSQNLCVYEADIFTEECDSVNNSGVCESYYKCEWTGNKCQRRTECDLATTEDECDADDRERCAWRDGMCKFKEHQTPEDVATHAELLMPMHGVLGQSFVPNS